MSEFGLSIDNLKRAITSLEIAYNIYRNDRQDDDKTKRFVDSCVKRFEYTFETTWKFMKKYFKLQYNKTNEELTINNIFRFTEAYGLTNSWLNWRKYYEYGNNTFHEYNFDKSNSLIETIPEFIQDSKFLINKWESL